MRSARVRLVAVALLSLLTVQGTAAASRTAAVEGEGFDMLATVPFDWALDAETTEVGGRAIVLGAAVSFNGHAGGLLVVDVEDPSAPKVRARLDCTTGSVANIVRTSSPTLFAVFVSPRNHPCLGLQSYGFALVDVSRPRRPQVVSSTPHFEPAPTDIPRRESIGQWAIPTAVGHPTAPFLYSTRVVQEGGEILVWSLENQDGPQLVGQIPTTSRPLDIDLDPAGTLLAVADGASFATYDLSEPSAPVAASTQQCPGCSQTAYVRFVGDDALVVYDASPNPAGCPAGALYFYALELGVPRLTGVYDPSRVQPEPDGVPYPQRCDVRDFDVSSDGKRALLTWGNDTVRLLEITDTTGVGATAAGAGPVTEAGWFRVPESRTWSARFGPGDVVLAIDFNAGLHTLRAP